MTYFAVAAAVVAATAHEMKFPSGVQNQFPNDSIKLFTMRAAVSAPHVPLRRRRSAMRP